MVLLPQKAKIEEDSRSASSVGSARDSTSQGRGFESPCLHNDYGPSPPRDDLLVTTRRLAKLLRRAPPLDVNEHRWRSRGPGTPGDAGHVTSFLTSCLAGKAPPPLVKSRFYHLLNQVFRRLKRVPCLDNYQLLSQKSPRVSLR